MAAGRLLPTAISPKGHRHHPVPFVFGGSVLVVFLVEHGRSVAPGNLGKAGAVPRHAVRGAAHQEPGWRGKVYPETAADAAPLPVLDLLERHHAENDHVCDRELLLAQSPIPSSRAWCRPGAHAHPLLNWHGGCGRHAVALPFPGTAGLRRKRFAPSAQWRLAGTPLTYLFRPAAACRRKHRLSRTNFHVKTTSAIFG